MIGEFRLHHASLSVGDLDAAMAFFTDAFGFVAEVVEHGLGEDIATMTGRPGVTCDFAQMRSAKVPVVLELIAFGSGRETRPEADPLPWRPGAGHVAFHVPASGFDAALDRLAELGAERLGGVCTWPGGRACYLRTPGDAVIEIEALD